MSDGLLLKAMIAAALEAGRAANRIYQGAFAVHTKADDSPVTAADHVAEEIILHHSGARTRRASPWSPRNRSPPAHMPVVSR